MTTRPNQTTALLVLDPYNDFIAEGGKLWPYLREVAERLNLHENLARLLAAARTQGLAVFFVPHHRHRDGDFEGWRFMNPTHVGARALRPFEAGTWGAEFHPAFQPRTGETVVHEHWLHNGFANTDLDYQLRNRGIDRVIIAGLRANACVEATARHAVELGYHVTLVKDATAAFKYEEWAATMEINAHTYAHAILTTDETVRTLEGYGTTGQGPQPVAREEASHVA